MIIYVTQACQGMQQMLYQSPDHKCTRTRVQSCASRINYSVFSDVKNSSKEQTNVKQKDTYKVSRAM